MCENRNLKKMLQAIENGQIKLSEFRFLEPISIAHLAMATKQNPKIIDTNHCSGPVATFLSRLNFFNFVNLPDPFGNNRYSGNNLNTIEINLANHANENVFEQVRDILTNESEENKETIERLLSELITNVEMYADGNGVVVGQVIDRVLQLSIVDTGPGITRHLKENLPEMSDKDDDYILKESLKKGVTSGRGRGYGLWQTSEVLIRNNGSLIIRTGNQVLNGLTVNCIRTNFTWIGTSIDLRYNLDRAVNFDEILALQNANEVSNEFGF